MEAAAGKRANPPAPVKLSILGYSTPAGQQIFNLLGNPAAAVPVGQSPHSLPAVQIVGRPFEDELVLSVAAKIEKALGDWKPPPEPGPQKESP